MSEPNIPLLRKMVEWVEEQETRTEGREWYQGWWISDRLDLAEDEEVNLAHFCDTAYCVAGKLATDAGWVPARGGATVTNGDYEEAVSFVAERLLGVATGEADSLFDRNNDAAAVRVEAERLAGERL